MCCAPSGSRDLALGLRRLSERVLKDDAQPHTHVRRVAFMLERRLRSNGGAFCRVGTRAIVRLALTRCLPGTDPSHHEIPAAVEIPSTETAEDLPKAIAGLLAAEGRGDLTPGEAGRLAALVGESGKALGHHDVEVRLQRLEGQQLQR